MDTAPPNTLVNEIKTIVFNVKDVKTVDKCYVRQTGFEYFVDILVVVDGNLTVRTGHDIVHVVKNAIM